MKFKDLIVEGATGHRHEVTKTATDEFRRHTIRQIVTVSRLPPSDAAYKVSTVISELSSIGGGDDDVVGDGDGVIVVG